MKTKLYGRSYTVTKYFHSIDRCNEYLAKHKDEGVLKVIGKRIYVCKLNDVGE